MSARNTEKREKLRVEINKTKYNREDQMVWFFKWNGQTSGRLINQLMKRLIKKRENTNTLLGKRGIKQDKTAIRMVKNIINIYMSTILNIWTKLMNFWKNMTCRAVSK